jgi:hypothetical protein
MPINSLSNANTFAEWLAATNAIIPAINGLVDGPNLVAKTNLSLTAPATSLSVSNISALNVTFSNTISVNTTAISAGNVLNVFGNANVSLNLNAGNVYTNRIFFSSGSSIGGVNDITIPATFVNMGTTANANVGTYLEVGQYVWVKGANSTFNGSILFSNTGLSINASGNISTSKNIFVSQNVLTNGLTVNTTSRISTLNVDTVLQYTSTSAIKLQGNTTVVGTDKTLTVEGILESSGANTNLGPYTEKCVEATLSTATNVNLKAASFFNYTLSTSVTLTLINAPAAGKMASATIIIKAGNAGAVPTFVGKQTNNSTNGTIRWPFGTAPTFGTTVGSTSVIHLFTVDGGVNWFGSAPILGATS